MADPFEVAFVETMYTIGESAGSVNVCVNLTRPQTDILDETVNVFVTDFPMSEYINTSFPLASERTNMNTFSFTFFNIMFSLISPAPDMPDFLSRYFMLERTDFQQQTSAVNLIDDTLITAVMRIICYNQIIYDDLRLEMNEYAGLTLGVRDDEDVTTVRTFVKDLFDQGAILIVDDDSEFFHAKCHRKMPVVFSPGAVVGLEQTFFSVSEDVGYVELCAVVTFPDIVCPIEFPFDVGLSTADGTAGTVITYAYETQPIEQVLLYSHSTNHGLRSN